MQPSDPFLPQILATPDDRDLRLVYADWLEERDDPRGEFIRLVEEMSGLAPSSERYAQLRVRRNELRQHIDKEWVTAMGYQPRHRPLFNRLPAGRAERWRLMEEFIDVWYGGLRQGDGASEAELVETEQRLGRRLPAALREWYTRAGKRVNVWSTQDYLIVPSRLALRREDGSLIFRSENQGCERWLIRARDLDQDDPPVYELYNPRRVSPTVSAFAILVLLYEFKFARDILSLGNNVSRELVLQEVKRLALFKCSLPTRYWGADPVHFYEGKDIVLETEQGGEWSYVSARTEGALKQLSEELLAQLERYQ